VDDAGAACAWTPVNCNSLPFGCACANGSTRLAGCGEAPTCDDACCGQGGWVPCRTNADCSLGLACAGGGFYGSGCQPSAIVGAEDGGCCVAGQCAGIPVCGP
jgi:hypothetical protein